MIVKATLTGSACDILTQLSRDDDGLSKYQPQIINYQPVIKMMTACGVCASGRPLHDPLWSTLHARCPFTTPRNSSLPLIDKIAFGGYLSDPWAGTSPGSGTVAWPRELRSRDMESYSGTNLSQPLCPHNGRD